MNGVIIDLADHEPFLVRVGDRTYLDRLVAGVGASRRAQKLVVAIPSASRFALSGANTKTQFINLLHPTLPPSDIFYYRDDSALERRWRIMRNFGMDASIMLTSKNLVVPSFMIDECLCGKQIAEYTDRLAYMTFDDVIDACAGDTSFVESMPTPVMDGFIQHAEQLFAELDIGASWTDILSDLVELNG